MLSCVSSTVKRARGECVKRLGKVESHNVESVVSLPVVLAVG
jgi:hypothetical protein